MQEICIYLNSKASGAGGDFWEKEITKRLFRSQLTFRRPETYDELNRFLSEDVERSVDSIVSVGGDGTVNTLIQKLAGKHIGLLVVPGGTANDLAFELGSLSKLDKVFSWIRSRESKYIDLISVNGKLMATNGGIGLGGNVAQKINELRLKVPLFKSLMNVTGKKIYSFFAATELMDPGLRYYKLRLSCDEYEGVVRCPGLLINNQATLGGSFKVAPFTTNNDGKFNVTVFTQKNRGSLIQSLWVMGQGGDITNIPGVLTFETDHLNVELIEGDDANFFGDGEILSHAKEWEIKCLPNSLLVYSRNEDFNPLDITNEVTLS